MYAKNEVSSNTISPAAPGDSRLDIALSFLRIWIGTMFIVHGSPKIFGGIPKLTATVDKMGFPLPEVFAWMAALSEFGGGVLLLLGLAVRPAAFFAATTMIVAAFVRHADDPFNKKELALTYLVILIFFMIVGGGRYAIGRLLPKRR